MTSPLEIAAVVLAVAYLVLAIRQNPWCWAAAMVSSAIYLWLMFEAALYMESALQIFYIAMAVYGWWCWTHPTRGRAGESAVLRISTWPLHRHVFTAVGILLLAGASGALLSRYTDAALPYLDSFTTWGAIVATYLVARKILENWLYWFVIDSVSVYLYVSRELYLTAALFVGYLVLIIVGYRAWRRDWQLSGSPA